MDKSPSGQLLQDCHMRFKKPHSCPEKLFHNRIGMHCNSLGHPRVLLLFTRSTRFYSVNPPQTNDRRVRERPIFSAITLASKIMRKNSCLFLYDPLIPGQSLSYSKCSIKSALFSQAKIPNPDIDSAI